VSARDATILGPPAPAARARAAIFGLPALAPPHESELAALAAPRRRRRALWLVALLLLAIGTCVGIRAALDRSAATPDAAVVALTPLDAAPLATPATVDAPHAEPILIEPAFDARPSGPRDARGTGRPARPDAARGTRADAASVSAAGDFGFVRIAGESFVRARILVDGKLAEYAPNPARVTVGRHLLEVIKEDGTRLGPITIEVTAYHTRTHPLRPTF
jgi:hypothetical protein